MAYTVEAIKDRSERSTKAGKPFVKYLLSLAGEGDVPFADFQNVNPQPGQTLDGFEIKDEGFGRELRKVGSGNGARPRPGRSPQETKAIVRQHSQEMAIRTLCFLHGLRGQPESPSVDWKSVLKEWTDFFEADVG